MHRWPIRLLICVALYGCATVNRPPTPVSDVDCPTPSPCDDPDQDALLRPGPKFRPAALQVAYRPLWPGCPTTLQVMARLHSIAFQAVRPSDEDADAPSDPSDWTCDPPDAPLLRAGRFRPDQNLATR